VSEIEVKYRAYYLGAPPSPIKPKIPGWAGDDRGHSDGSEAQPWHCLPFVEGSTYGYEFLYPYRTECRVVNSNGRLVFEGDFSQEDWDMSEDGSPIGPGKPKKTTAPMMNFSEGHYGMSSLIDLDPPEGYAIRTEPHPRFYTDKTGTCPIMVVGHLQRWWSNVFFVVFKAPRDGEAHIFRHNEPCGQFLFVPQDLKCRFSPMSPEEVARRERRQFEISSKKIETKSWRSDKGYSFTNKYKVLSAAYQKHGEEGIENILRKDEPRTLDFPPSS
jgi:hypothetical protein